MQALNDIGNPDAPVGSRDWVMAYNLQAQEQLWDATSVCNSLRTTLGEMKQNSYYKLLLNKKKQLFETWPEYCLEFRPWGLGTPTEIVDAMLADVAADKLISTAVLFRLD